MGKVILPDLKNLMDHKVLVKLNANRAVTGVLRGFDQFMNLVVEETVEEGKTGRFEIGSVECLEKSA